MEQIDIDRINSAGQGIGKAADGRAVFVDGALPGESAVIAVRQEKKSYISARVERIVTANPHRREPLCPWYRSCGGCQLQHADYALQCRIKSMLAEDALRRIGGFDISASPECVPSPAEWGYRNRGILQTEKPRNRPRHTLSRHRRSGEQIVRPPENHDRTGPIQLLRRTDQ